MSTDDEGQEQGAAAPGTPPAESPDQADTTWLASGSPGPAETAALGERPTAVDPLVPPAPPATPSAAPGWSSPSAPSWTAPTPPAAPPTTPSGPPPPSGPPLAGPPPVAPAWTAPAGQPGAALPPPSLPGVTGWGAVAQAPKPGVVPLRPLGVGEILDGAVSYMRRDPKTVLGISALVATAIALLQVVLYASFGNFFDLLVSDPSFTNSDVAPDTGLLARGIAQVGAATLVFGVVSFLLSVLATGMLTAAMGRAVLGRSVSPAYVWGRARARFWPLLGLTLLVGLIVGAVMVAGLGLAIGLGVLVGQQSTGLGVLLGLGLALAGGVITAWLTVQLLLAPVALMLEDVGVTTALRRSYRLVTGAWWRTFGIYILATIIASVVGQVLAVPFALLSGVIGAAGGGSSALGGNPFGLLPSLVTALGTLVSQTVTVPFTAGIVALLYVDRRIRREALDIELARAAGVPGT